jgi:hypothetical protein
MSPDLLAFLILVTSTAIVLGVAVTLRGLYGFVSDASPRLPEPSLGDASGNDAGSSTTLDGAPGASADAPTMPSVPVVRDLREPLVMVIGGVFIVSGALIALATLISSAP